MAQSNLERVGKALELLKAGLQPFFEREMRAAYGAQWEEQIKTVLRDDTMIGRKKGQINWDTAALLNVMDLIWTDTFKKILGKTERSIVIELKDVRNRWAHQKAFSTDDTYRALDSAQRLLSSISAPEAAEIERMKQEVLRLRFEEQSRKEVQKTVVAPIEGKPAGGFRPWREVITPHPDVASGRYQQAEFSADLAQVHYGEGTEEYSDPREFFRRTFVTEGLKTLLSNALLRLKGEGGDPVVELQTNFGGGKTHSMLALYHLFSGIQPGELPGLEPVLEAAGITKVEKVSRAVLVGTAISPGQTHRQPDGTEIRTLWGELTWQLGKKKGYALVADADKTGMNPGSDVLRELFTRYAPCLILIDEWVAFVRQLYGIDGMPAGSFDANLTFAQSLTEAARQAPQTLVVASIPSSDIEVGGEGGKAALERLRNTFSRLESSWRPASAEEGFEIVRRRLFQPITDPQLFVARDAVVRAFAEMYRGQPAEFPSQCREGAYERRLQAAYPIHPELFDRLYSDWSSLDRFQRTRGVLRLMAAVIHTLWEHQDGNLLILPASVPIDAPPVQSELTHYLDDPWVPVIEKDVDGPHSLPLELDQGNPNLGRYSACRRVARTLYMGSAPTLHTGHRGLDDRSIKLGCTQPGEAVATFGDALRRLTDQATHLYVDGPRYWFSTQPSVTRLAQDRAFQQKDDDVKEEIQRRLRAQQKQRADFVSVHACPPSNADVPDEAEVRLVILSPDHPHASKTESSPARQWVATTLERRGSSPRRFRNMLVFLAPDKTRLGELDQAVRQYLAWKSIEAEKETLNLDAFQSKQATSKREQADETVKRRIPETYYWLLVPSQPSPQGSLEWEEIRLQGDDALAVRASKKLRNDGLLITQFAGTLLRREIDRIPLWRDNHVGVKQLWEDFAQYLYLPRLQDSNVLLAAIDDGLPRLTWEPETFAYAQDWDAERNSYRGLTAGKGTRIALDASSLVVKPEAARCQLDAEEAAQREKGTAGAGTPHGDQSSGQSLERAGVYAACTKTPVPVAPPKLGRFHGVVTLDSSRVGRDAGKIAEEIIQHLTGLMGSKVEVTLEIHAEIPDGASDQVIRTITENCHTLRFKTHGFEEV